MEQLGKVLFPHPSGEGSVFSVCSFLILLILLPSFPLTPHSSLLAPASSRLTPHSSRLMALPALGEAPKSAVPFLPPYGFARSR